MKRHWAVMVCILGVVLGVSAPAAHAQGRFRADIDVTFGFNGSSLVVERWNTVRVGLTTNRDFGGAIVVSYAQDGSQDASISTPISAVAGRRSVVEIEIAPSQITENIEFTLVSDRGRAVDRWTYSNTSALAIPDTERIVNIGLIEQIVGVGVETLPRPGQVTPWQGGRRPDEETGFDWNGYAVVSGNPMFLPNTWAGYASAAGVVLSESVIRRMSADQRSAMRDWVHAGGSLVVVLEAAGEGVSLLGLDAAVTTAQPRAVAVPSALADLVRAAAAGDGDGSGEDELTAGLAADGVGADDGEKAPIVWKPAIPVRPIEIAESAKNEGWRGVWATPSGEVVAASGPARFGMVALLSFDPLEAMVVPRRETARLLWGTLLREVIRPTSESQFAGGGWWGYSRGSGLSDAEHQSINGALDAITTPPRVAGLVIGLTLGAFGVLGLWLAIGDMLVLGRLRLRHRGGLVAMGWVLLASAAAIVVPEMIQTGGSVLGRHRVFDVPHDPSDGVWSSGVISVFAGSRTRVELDGSAAGTWWRGVSPLSTSVRGVSVRPTLPTRRSRQIGPIGAMPTTSPMPFTQPVWTLRTLHDTGPTLAGVRVTLTPEVRGAGVRARFIGLPEGARITDAKLLIREGSSASPPDMTSDDSADHEVPLTSLTIHVADLSERRPWERQRAPRDPVHQQLGAHSSDLPWSTDRSLSLERRIKSGNWAVVIARVERLPSDITSPGLEVGISSAVYRVVVPWSRELDEAINPDAAEGSP